jgi:hypothetical protein
MKDGSESPLKLLLTPKDIPIFLLKRRTSLLSPYPFSEIKNLMKTPKFSEKTTMVFSERILNGYPMDLESPPLLMLSISDFQDTIFIILKPTLTSSSWELLVSTILSPPKEEPLIVSLFLMMNLITGPYVPLTEPLPLTGSVPFLKFLDYLVPKKEKEKPPLLKKSLSNLC